MRIETLMLMLKLLLLVMTTEMIGSAADTGKGCQDGTDAS